MPTVYYSHSYRKPDANIVVYFMKEMEREGIFPSLDPPSESVNSAKLERHLRSTDGMIAVLTTREDGFSKHILYEIKLCLQAQKPILIFIEDTLPNGIVPLRCLQRRFSRKSFFRQTKEHRHAVKIFKSYIGDDPVPNYQPSFNKRSCLLIGATDWPRDLVNAFDDFIAKAFYEVIKIDAEVGLISSSEKSEALISADLAICYEDSSMPLSRYFFGAAKASFVPTISLTTDVNYPFDKSIPPEYQARTIDLNDAASTIDLIGKQINTFEEEFLVVENIAGAEAYGDTLKSETAQPGQYSEGTRSVYVHNVNITQINMGDSYSAGQVGAQGPGAHAHDINFNQVWNNISGSTNLALLADELGRLRQYLKENAKEANEDIVVGNVAQAEQEAKKGNGGKVLEFLSKAGKWALDAATKIGTSVATEALKKAMGL
jgi:hypothetical protein